MIVADGRKGVHVTQRGRKGEGEPAYFHLKTLSATKKLRMPQTVTMASWGQITLSPCPSLMIARSAWLSAASGSALITG